ncbi:hypothetical protein EB796_022388 [Bugula neritina]|uniref:Uncharacterized protein n=1 Tax=Bugula neritina TaxID=10212 RepID=A0A7J7IZG8_BUGNE|nr:hypothetical protein EB796_022388 [Bugula neritina]
MGLDTITVPVPQTFWDSFVGGVNFSIAGTGGPECVAFIPYWQKVWETLLALVISFSFTYGGWSQISKGPEAKLIGG